MRGGRLRRQEQQTLGKVRCDDIAFVIPRARKLISTSSEELGSLAVANIGRPRCHRLVGRAMSLASCSRVHVKEATSSMTNVI